MVKYISTSFYYPSPTDMDKGLETT
jgi:hypothetical protein